MRLILSAAFLFAGLFFFITGTIGLLRFPDFYTRAHAGAKCDTLGVCLCLISLVIYSGFNYFSGKLLLVIAFLWVTSPTATHLIAKAAYSKNQKRYDGAE